jgi:alkyl sulfatase BDS1-like metallo-beta-lactamase superfamily hydrolase
MWAPKVMDLNRLREVRGLEHVENRAYSEIHRDVHPSLTHLSRVMEPSIEQIADNVYNAVGFDVANTTFVIGNGGVIVIDAMTAIENMAAALTAFREICEYPVRGIVYSHSHGDHWAGSPALEDAEGVARVAMFPSSRSVNSWAKFHASTV